MTRARRGVLATFWLFAACSTTPPLPEPPSSHPASPLADEAPEPSPSQTLVMPVRTPPPPGSGTGTGRGH